MSKSKIKIKYLPSLDANADTPLMMIPFPDAKVILTPCVRADLFFWNLEGMYPWLVWCSWFWQDIILCWKPCFSGAVPQSFLRPGYLLGFSPQFGSYKTLFSSYYRLFIDYFHWQFYIHYTPAHLRLQEDRTRSTAVSFAGQIFTLPI